MLIFLGITNVAADEWLGRCILTLTHGDVGCVSTEEIQNYNSGYVFYDYSVISKPISKNK